MAARGDYYQVLGISRGARTAEVSAAYTRLLAEFAKDTTPPDPQRESLLRVARDVLSDPARRAAYDAELAAAPTPAKRARGKAQAPRNMVIAIAAIAVVAAAAVATIFAMRPKADAPLKARAVEDLRRALAGSVSPIITYDISGKATPAGLAWVIEDRAMIANCRRLPPGVQLMVTSGTKAVPARVTLADESLGLCKILTDAYVGEPIAVSGAAPAIGAKVYATVLGAAGEVGLAETKVAKVADAPSGKAIQAALEAQPGGNGGPLLDAQGRVIGVATLQLDGSTLHHAVPAAWLAGARPRVEEPRPYQGGGTGATASAATAGGGGARWQYAPPPESLDYGCDCDFSQDKQWVAEREEKWKKIAELPPGEREKAAQIERMSEESTRKTMKEMNERFRK
jgi:hypothetical protein